MPAEGILRGPKPKEVTMKTTIRTLELILFFTFPALILTAAMLMILGATL